MEIYRDSINQLFERLNDNYNKHNKLPVLAISELEWDIFFEVIYSWFYRKRIQNDFYGGIHLVTFKALNLAIIDGSDMFSMDYLIKALSVLSCFNITIDEIKMIEFDIKENLYKANAKMIKKMHKNKN